MKKKLELVKDQVDLFEKCRKFTRAADARKEGIYPYFMPINGSEGTEVMINGKHYIMAGANNYLGLTHDPRVLSAAEETARKYGTGCTGSRFLNGTLDLHEALEHELADFVGREAALVFSTGFQTNLGLLTTLLGRRDAIVIDKIAHASIVDGARMSGAQIYRYKHNDMDDLQIQMDKIDKGTAILLAVDGLFSMDGDLARLPKIVEIAKNYPSRIYVDEAHSLGVIGPTGAGVCEKFDLIDEVDVIMGTFSKSFASIGGFIAGPADILDYVKHHARSMIFSASMPPYAVATVRKCLEIIRTEPERRERLSQIQRKMREELTSLGFDTGQSVSPIIPIIVGNDIKTAMLWRGLMDAGVFTNPVIPPAVPEKSSRLRTSYMATHTDRQLDRMLSIFEAVGKKTGVI